jgi:hypothetical protein
MQLSKLLGLFGITTAALIVGAAACGGGDGGSGGTGTGSAGGNGGNGGSGANTGGTASGTGTGNDCTNNCTSPDPDHEEIDYVVGGNVTGTITDQSGAIAIEIITDVCGTNLCLFGEADGAGTFTVPGMDSTLTDVRLLYGNGKEFAKMGARLPNCDTNGCDNVGFGDINTIALPPVAMGVDMTPGGDVSQGGVTLAIGGDACVTHDIILYAPDESGFRATVLEYGAASALNLPAVDQANLGDDLMLVATAPINTVICPGATMTFPAAAAWTDGATVEVYFHGTKTFKHYAPYGEWTKVGEGTVGGGNVTMSTPIEMLGLFAARIKP